MLEQMKILTSRIRAWLGRRGVQEEFSRELEEHLALLTDENVRRGMTPEEAKRAARVRLGGMMQLRETNRELHGWTAAETLFQDVRYALRTLRKSPGFTAVCVLTLGLGIGASTAIFSVVNGVLLRPLPYANHDRLVRIGELHQGSAGGLSGNFGNATYANYNDLERAARTVENLSAFREWSYNLTSDGDPEQVPGALVSGNFFAAMGSGPALGRMITPEDDAPGTDNNVAVLSYALWQRRFGGERGIVGKTLRINGEDFRVVGVMPRGFDYPQKSEVWSPLVPHGKFHDNRRAHLLTIVADVRAGQTIGSAQAEIAAIGQRIEEQNASEDPDMALATVSLKKSIVAPVQPALEVLVFAVGLLLMMACANLANLLLARGGAREKEFSLRTALGAGRARLVRQLLTESFVVAMLGAAAGLGLAAWSLQFISALDSQDLPRFGEISLDWRILGFTLLISCFSGLLFGLAPALSGAKTDLNTSLKEGAGISAGASRRGASSALIVPQFALAVVLLVGAGLLGNSFVRLLQVNPGFNPHGVLAAQLFFSPVEYPEGDIRGAVALQQMVERVRSIPGVRSAGMVTALPITGGASTDFVIEGRPAPPANDEPSADIRSVDSGYFRAMGIPLLAGREFTEADNSTAKRVMAINETMARRYWPNENPIGQRVTMKDWGPPLTGEIVGVVGDVKTNGLDEAVGPMIYWPYFQFPEIFNTIVVRSDGDPSRLAPAVKAAIWSVNKHQPISQMGTMEQVLSESLARRRLYMILLGVFAGAALLLAGVGIYGMVSYSVSQRIREMGIRIAVGAERGDVLRMVLGQGARVALAGIAAGIVAALGLTRLMTSLLFGVSPTDPQTFAGVAGLLTLVAVGACFVPARRATRVDPMVALRHE
ncbi:MAG TPA: ABC transporter permease [Candidatus Methylomirabilis sp.]|nr:ABC transporter permease [Candidatus Methylomirabilis sp.]